MVNLLLSHGANVNSADKREKRAIHWAAYHGKNLQYGNMQIKFNAFNVHLE